MKYLYDADQNSHHENSYRILMILKRTVHGKETRFKYDALYNAGYHIIFPQKSSRLLQSSYIETFTLW